MASPEQPLEGPRTRWFATTHWSVILAAGQGDSPSKLEALSTLCETYWYPLYAYVRRRGYAPAEAKDLTQSFFANLIEKGSFARAERQRGRFRTFLLHSIEHFLLNERDRALAQKRGGGRIIVSWDQQVAEERYGREPLDGLTPSKMFEKRWAATLIERVLDQLRQEFLLSGKLELFGQLEPHLWGDNDSVPYADLATQFNLTVVAVKSTVHRLRHRCRELLRREIAQTVATCAEVDDEIRHLIQVMSD